ncbi:hypothetical protein [Paenibacillus polymyxa]|uniref:hypothetical protein n=1 Tax=Paenibacillus polymyxa TaxID=1406 RepID=UPI001585E6EF|nr:hypothetical protein [Paenibacillus polymyxa]
MKAKINGIEVEGTSEEIARFYLLTKEKTLPIQKQYPNNPLLFNKERWQEPHITCWIK